MSFYESTKNTLNPSDIKALESANYIDNLRNTNDTVLKEEFSKIIHSPEFRVIGFLNEYAFVSEGLYVSKYTINGTKIASINLETYNGTFYEGCKHFYCWYENTLYKVTQQLEIEWSKEFDLNISSAYIDYRGDCYILFESSRTVRKILKSGEESVYIDGSDNPEYSVYLHRLFITKGGGWLYVLGSQFHGYNNTCDVFIDKYNTRTWDKVDRLIVSSNTHVSENNPEFNDFVDFTLSGDFFYIFSKVTLSKITIKGLLHWEGDLYADKYEAMTFSDNTYTEVLYYLKKPYSDTAAWKFAYMGAIEVRTGNIKWETRIEYEYNDTDLHWALYQNNLYISNRAYVENNKEYLLSVDNDKFLFQTRNNKLIKLIKYNWEELYSADNYYGMRLLASEIKDGIEKLEYVPLLHDDGDVINEDDDLLLIPLENEQYTDLENYTYKYLLASQYRVDPPELSLLYTKELQPIFTKLKNVIKTKSPVIPDTIHEFITNSSGEYLESAKNFDIVRARFRYSFDKYLLADLNMFSTDIITKNLGYTIITKKYGHDIIMKTRKVYTYVFAKYNEMNIIAEWLKENGVMDTNLPDIVEEARHHTYDAIQDIQIAGTPQIYDVNAYKQFEYTFDGYKYVNNTWRTQIFSCTNLPWDKRKCISKIYIDSLANIIKKQEMRPILFFLNGKAIPWSDCTIVRDWSYNYLLIKDHDPYESDLSAIIFPCDIRYGEDNKVLDEDQVNGYFYFDKDGYSLSFEDRKNTAIRIEVIDKNIWGSPTTDTPFNIDGTAYFEVMNHPDQKSSEKNLIIFEDNLLFPDARYYVQDLGKDVYIYDHNINNLMVKAFYWIKANSYYGLETKPLNQEYMLKEPYKYLYPDPDKVFPSPYEEPFNALYDPFNFKMKRSKTYEQNIADALAYIIKYDNSLLKKYWKSLSYTSSFTYTGEYLINRVPKDGGWLLMPRSRKTNFDDYIMVFRNNRLYEYYKEIDYTDCYFKIPIFNHVERDDIIEIIHFKNINNNYYTLTVNKGESDYLSEDLRHDDFLLSGNSPSTENNYASFNRENSIQYDIGFIYKNNYTNDRYTSTDIELEDEFYYGKEINIYSKHQFRYMYYNIFSPKKVINLSPDFRFCHEKNKYLIFINGTKLHSSLWTLNVMTNEVNLKYINISFTDYLEEGDLIEIFYLPIGIVSEIAQVTVPTKLTKNPSGLIDNKFVVGYGYAYNWRLTTDQQFGFDKDINHVYINGGRVPSSQITNISDGKFFVEYDDAYIDDRLVYANIYNKYYPNNSRALVQKDIVEIESYMIPELLLGKLVSYIDKWNDSMVEDPTDSDSPKLMAIRKEDITRDEIKRMISRLKI